MNHTADQSELRKNSIRARRQLDNLKRLAYSDRIADRLERLPVFRSANTVAVYLSSWDEVDTSEIILRSWRANKSVVAPVIKKNARMAFVKLEADTQLRNNRYGLLEPAASHKVCTRDINLVITPLSAFDESGARIGMGGGYYDRYFSQLAHRHAFVHPRMIGIAFDCQRATKIPENPWDISLYACITENKAYTF
ncbi:MAG: 5-formyltetrahydrofolate cyclo-ligase [Pseudomonadota bacterium]